MKPAAKDASAIAMLEAENDTLRNEIARLNSVIDAYGRHHDDCDLAFPTCSCGLRSKWKGRVQ